MGHRTELSHFSEQPRIFKVYELDIILLLLVGVPDDLHCIPHMSNCGTLEHTDYLLPNTMLLAMRERIFATTMDEQRTDLVFGRLPPMIVWLLAADGLENKGQSPFKGKAPVMQLLSRPIHFSLLRISVQL